MTARFLTVGESLTDIVVRADGERTEYPGGSPMNVAVALGRLGHDSHLLTRVGSDARGAAIREHVERSGVRLTPGSLDDRPTSTATARIRPDGSADYDFDLVWDIDAKGLPDRVDAVHTSSIAAILSPGAAAVEDVVRRFASSATISYDPNARPQLMGDPAAAREIVERLIGLSHVVKSSDEDVEWFYGTHDVEDVVSSWRDRGPAITVLTRGGDGAVAFCGTSRVEVASHSVEVADTVGAGDTFSAGILHALAERDLLGADRREQLADLTVADLEAVLATATALAAVTVSRPGADPPWLREIA